MGFKKSKFCFIIFPQVSQNSSLILQENSTNVRLQPVGKLPNMFTFFVSIEGNNTVPTVKRFSLNEHILCDDEERVRFSISFDDSHHALHMSTLFSCIQQQC